MKKREGEPASRPDRENPEWSAVEIRKARPAFEVIGEVFGHHVSKELRRGRGRPRKQDRKINQTLRLDADVLAAYRKAGKGWQRRINEVLREHMPTRKSRTHASG